MAEPDDIGINDGESEDDSPPNKRIPKPDLDRLAGARGGAIGRRMAAFWKNQIIQVDDDKEFKRWLKRGAQIEKRYRDDRNRIDEDSGQRRVNSLWANVEILTPALYGKMPVPTCERKFKDKDPVGRGAAQIIERALRNEIEICGFDEAMRQALRDYLLSGRGTTWVRYEPEYGEGISLPTDEEMDEQDAQGTIEKEDDSEEEVKLRETGDRVTRESTPVDFIQWTDFYTFPSKARIWREVTAVAKRVYMTRAQMKRRFGNEIGRAIPFQRDDRKTRRQEDTGIGHEVEEKAQIFEIWDKSKEEVLWVAEGYQYLCDRKDDPLRLEGFFPCPKPLYANATNNTLIPIPDFIQYQDQAIQIDDLTQRIAMLTKACKMAGVYNAAAKGIQRLFNESVENEMIPIDDWAAFAEKGGVEGNLSFIPLKELMGLIEQLTKVKERNVAEMDRLTGINDIMRGTTDERETLGGQRLKSNASGTRLKHRQNEIARLARDTLRIMADIMCQHFSAQSLIEVSGALYEQGLGTMDMPEDDVLQNDGVPPNLGPPSAPPGAGGPFSPGGAPPQAQLPPPGPPPGMGAPPMGAPPPPMGGPPGAGPPRPPGMPGMPPGPPGAPPPQIQPPQPGMSPQGANPSQMGFQGPMPPQGPPPIPPGLMDKIKGIQRIAKAIKLIRNEKLLGFRVEIEVESTVYADEHQEAQERTAFIASVTKFMQESMAIAAQMPQAAPLLGKFLQFGVRGFNVGRELEQAIEDFCDEAVVAAKQHAANPQPNPEQIKANAMMAKAQADIQGTHLKMQSDQSQAQAEVQRQQIENAGEQANAAADTQQKQMDMEMRKMEMQIELVRLQIEKLKAEADLKGTAMKSQADQQQTAMDQQMAHLDFASKQQQMGMDRETEAQKVQSQREQQMHDRYQQYQDAVQQQKQREHEDQTAEQDMDLQERQHKHAMEQTRQQMNLSKQQHGHARQQAADAHKIAKVKLAQQRAAANRPRSTQ
jgi:hypothetical protein